MSRTLIFILFFFSLKNVILVLSASFVTCPCYFTYWRTPREGAFFIACLSTYSIRGGIFNVIQFGVSYNRHPNLRECLYRKSLLESKPNVSIPHVSIVTLSIRSERASADAKDDQKIFPINDCKSGELIIFFLQLRSKVQ